MAKERPILFSTPMVQALLNGTKTQTRRVLKQQNTAYIKCPYGQPGDVLWVRETWSINDIRIDHKRAERDKLLFKASHDVPHMQPVITSWKPSIRLPKAHARIWLEITEVKVERLQNITEEDAKAEGAADGLAISEFSSLKGLGDWPLPSPFTGRQLSFLSIWCKINGSESWLANPWVWVVKFEVLSTSGRKEAQV